MEGGWSEGKAVEGGTKGEHRHHMEYYGTFKMDSIHGRLFELQMYIESYKFHVLIYFAFVIVALVVWPIGALLAIPIGLFLDKNRDMQMLQLIMITAFVLGCAIWFVPTIILWTTEGKSFMDQLEYFRVLIYDKKQMNFLDCVDFYLSEFMVLLFCIFSWAYHDVFIDTDRYKHASKVSWHHRTGEYGLDVYFRKEQRERLQGHLSDVKKELTSHYAGSTFAIDKETADSRKEEFEEALADEGVSAPVPEPSPRESVAHLSLSSEDSLGSARATEGKSTQKPGSKLSRHATLTGSTSETIAIEDVVHILETLPGWQGATRAVSDHVSTEVGEQMGIYDDLAKLAGEAKEKKIWPLDIWLTRSQFYPETPITIINGLTVVYKTSLDMALVVLEYLSMNPKSCVLMVVLAGTRTMLGRIWLALVNDGHFWPSDPVALEMVTYSTLLTFVVSFFWLGLFFLIIMEYRRTVAQMVITSALVDARKRVTYHQCYLMSGSWFKLKYDEAEAELSKLPLLDLRTSSNAAAFWRLREYCTLDRSNERMSVSILLEIVVLWLLLKFIVTVVVIYIYGGLPAILIVTLYDLFVFGGMCIFALQCALQINSMMDTHKESFVQARYEVTMDIARLDEREARGQQTTEYKRRDLNTSRKLLEEYLDMANEADSHSRDCILFGLVVTPGKIVNSLVSLLSMVGLLLAKMIRTGVINAPDVLEDGAHRVGKKSFMAMYSTLSTHAHSQ